MSTSLAARHRDIHILPILPSTFGSIREDWLSMEVAMPDYRTVRTGGAGPVGFRISPISTFGLEGLTQRMGGTRFMGGTRLTQRMGATRLTQRMGATRLTQHMGGTRFMGATRSRFFHAEFAHKHVRPGRPHSAYGRHPIYGGHPIYGRHPIYGGHQAIPVLISGENVRKGVRLREFNSVGLPSVCGET